MNTVRIAGAVRAMQLSGEGHAVCAHIKTSCITNTGGKHRQTHKTFTQNTLVNN